MQVRFHVQFLFSVVMYGILLPLMVANHMKGDFAVSPLFFLTHFASSIILPGAISPSADIYRLLRGCKIQTGPMVNEWQFSTLP